MTSLAISGNRVLRDAFLPGMGEALVKRLDSDLRSVPAVTHAVLLEGINDIGMGLPGNPVTHGGLSAAAAGVTVGPASTSGTAASAKKILRLITKLPSAALARM